MLFSAPMVRALLAGAKTQTRRVLKPQPTKLAGPNFDGAWSDTVDPVVRYFACPYGKPGDRLWVKETWRAAAGWDIAKPTDITAGATVQYLADGALIGDVSEITPGKTRVSLFMARWMSRITLEITSVRVERLNAISEAAALAEGVKTPWGNRPHLGSSVTAGEVMRGLYRELWESINGPGSWALNPWVWVITVERVLP